GEGIVCLDLIAKGTGDQISAQRVLDNYSLGQLLVAGWGTIQPALEIRRLQRERNLYVETFLAAVYPTTEGRIIAIVPEESPLPSPESRPLDSLRQLLPPNSLVYRRDQLPNGPQ